MIQNQFSRHVPNSDAREPPVFLRFCPLSKKLTIEEYDYEMMHQQRLEAISQTKQLLQQSTQGETSPVAMVFQSGLGRQGNPVLVDRARDQFARVLNRKRRPNPDRCCDNESACSSQTCRSEHAECTADECNDQQQQLADSTRVVHCLLSELTPSKLDQFVAPFDDATVQQPQFFVQVACPRLSVDWGAGFSKPLLTPYELDVALGQVDYKPAYPMDFYSDAGGPWSNYHQRQQQRPHDEARAQRIAELKAKRAKMLADRAANNP